MLISIEEKPKLPKSNNAVIGLYFYPNIALDYVKNIKPSSRGEKEITTLNQKFLKKLKLSYTQLGRGAIWFDPTRPINNQRNPNTTLVVPAFCSSQGKVGRGKTAV